MRLRTIKPGFFDNEELAALPAHARLLFAGLWCMADREGRLEDRPARVKARVFPYEDVKVPALLEQLAKAGFIDRYQAGGSKVIQVVNWSKHQKPHPREASSTLPSNTKAVPRHDLGDVEPGGVLSLGSCLGDLVLEDSCAETVSVSPPPPAVLAFPCDGKVPSWILTKPYLTELQELFPHLDVLAQARAALAWVKANPEKRKTARGMPAFLTRWLTHETDSPKRDRRPAATAAPTPKTYREWEPPDGSR